MRAPHERLRVLVKRIEDWENLPEVEDTRDFLDRIEDDEELLLDIKQCLESVLEVLAPQREAQGAIEKEAHANLG